MTKFSRILVSSLTALIGATVYADTDANRMTVISTTQSTYSDVNYDRKFGIGFGFAYNSKAVETENSYGQITPEVSGYAYYPVGSSMIVRPGIRLGYTGSQQPQKTLAKSISINEYDFKGLAEIGFLFPNTSFLIPAFSVGGGSIYRVISLKTQAPVIQSDEAISRSSYLPFVQGQVSGIIPFENGQYEIAPFFRYVQIFNDSRVNWYIGVEGSLGLF